MVPLSVVMGDITYQDGSEAVRNNFFRYWNRPMTCPPPPSHPLEILQNYTEAWPPKTRISFPSISPPG